jgi:hypothetical protein
LESYLELMVSALINIRNMNWHESGEYLGSVFSCSVAFLFLLTP